MTCVDFKKFHYSGGILGNTVRELLIGRFLITERQACLNQREETSVQVGPVLGLPTREHTQTQALHVGAGVGLRSRRLPELRDGYSGPVTKGISSVTRASEMTADLPRVLWER